MRTHRMARLGAWLLPGLWLLCAQTNALALGQPPYVTDPATPGGFPIVNGRAVAAIYVDKAEPAGVQRAAADLQRDIARVTGRTPFLTHEPPALGSHAILVGTLGHSHLIDSLAQAHRIDAA